VPDIVIAPPAGETFDTLAPQYFGEFVNNIGDFNGDGWDDLLASFQSRMLIYFCGPGADTLYDLKLQGRTRFAACARDINGDGYDDMISGNIEFTEFGTINLYLGGPGYDQLYDEMITRQELPPLFLDNIGQIVSSAGDMNNDGMDDFMFSCRNFIVGEPGDVFIFKGSDKIVTDVEEPLDDILPTGFQLFQNYPNPFNPTTEIRFSLSEPGRTRVEIFNLLGLNVITLVNQFLEVGEHSVTWDANDENGKPMPTGIYLCQIYAGQFSESRKMLLLK
jgi:hypothetical protein